MNMKEYKLNIDPRILELLGPSLYTNIYYIIAELIANAYDADAHNVYIIDNGTNITVEDDGNGMSYVGGEIGKYLNVARISRNSESDAETKLGRKKMGRKGVGKLAALSVSENVLVKTITNDEKSGFILSRNVKDDRLLEALDESEIKFEKIKQHGTAIVMLNPQYKLHATIKAIKRNLLKLFPKNGVSNFIFTQFTVRSVALNDSKKITQINKYCVSEALAKMGWLYIPMEPGPEEPHPDVKTSIRIVTDKLASTFDDKKRSLFQAMKDMLVYIDEATMEKNFYFGTDNFDHVWEKLIDKAFGIRDKNKYFPRARWLLDYGKYKEKYPLQPDTIMIYKNKYYVLDAKCYKYGRTGSPNDLPDSSSINKQITYGEYLRRTMGIQNDCLYNAFILPFNKSENIFDITENIGTIGEAVGDWRENLEYYERIQGIVLDTRHLMYAYLGNPVEDKEALAECIEMVKKRNPVPSAPGSVKPILTPVSYLNKSFNGSLGLVAENTAYGGQNIEHSTRALGDE